MPDVEKKHLLYGSFAVGCLLVYYKLEAPPNAEYDYLITLAAGFQTLGFLALIADTADGAAEGLSEKTLWAFIVTHITRISTTSWGEGYIPEDNTGDVYLYQALEVIGVIALIFQVMRLGAVRSSQEVGQSFERHSQLIAMCVVSAILAYFTKSTGHDDYYADLLWMFATWLEAMALGPQVHLLLTSAGSTRIDESASHFAMLTMTSALTDAFFWGRMMRDRYSEFQKDNEHQFFHAIGLATFMRVALSGVYVYLFRSQLNKKPDYELCAHDEL